MLKKIIAVGITATLASASMIYASNSNVVTKADDFPAEVEDTVVFADTSAEATTATLAASPAEEGAAMRELLNVKVGDVVVFESREPLEYADGRLTRPDIRELVYIIGIDDENQRFRVYVPSLCTIADGTVLYLWYTAAGFAIPVEGRQGYMLGDLYQDGQIDVFDLAIFKHSMLRGWNYKDLKICADIDGDGEVNVVDLVILQRWVHGIKEPNV